MKQLAAIGFALILTAQAVAGQDDSFVGIYLHPRPVVTIEGEYIGFSPLPELHFEVCIANEEGHHEIFLPNNIAESLEVELERNGRRISNEKLNIIWSDEVTRLAYYTGLPPEPFSDGLVESGVEISTSLTLSLRGDRSFGAGSYTVRLRLRQDAALLANGDGWNGRGGVGGRKFTLRDTTTAEDQLRLRKLEAMTALHEDKFRDAASLWRSITQTNPDDLDGWAGLGVASFHLGEHRKAAECLERLMPETSGDMPRSTLPLLLAESYVHLGDLEGASTALRHMMPEADIPSRLAAIQNRVAGTQ